MKTVIYKDFDEYKTTTEENYNARIQNERKIHNMQGFDNAKQIIEYYIKYFGSSENDFIVIDE